jgi:hypothetical protein
MGKIGELRELREKKLRQLPYLPYLPHHLGCRLVRNSGPTLSVLAAFFRGTARRNILRKETAKVCYL